jgi:hypothetical protein
MQSLIPLTLSAPYRLEANSKKIEASVPRGGPPIKLLLCETNIRFPAPSCAASFVCPGLFQMDGM